MTDLRIDDLDFDDDSVKILNFPITRQATKYTCGDDATQRVMAYYGEDFRESELVEMLKTTEDGTYVKNIVSFFHHQGLETELKEEMTIDELKSYIDRKIPVIVLIQAWGTEAKFKKKYAKTWSDGHFVVVIGYTDKLLLISDPALYNVGYIPIPEFLQRWHDVDDKKVNRLGLAVFGRKPKFDKEKIERIK
jgi:predicted double-glycine peptidase